MAGLAVLPGACGAPEVDRTGTERDERAIEREMIEDARTMIPQDTPAQPKDDGATR